MDEVPSPLITVATQPEIFFLSKFPHICNSLFSFLNDLHGDKSTIRRKKLCQDGLEICKMKNIRGKIQSAAAAAKRSPIPLSFPFPGRECGAVEEWRMDGGREGATSASFLPSSSSSRPGSNSYLD